MLCLFRQYFSLMMSTMSVVQPLKGCTPLPSPVLEL